MYPHSKFRYLNPRLRYFYFRFRKTNGSHIKILLPVCHLIICVILACYFYIPTFETILLQTRNYGRKTRTNFALFGPPPPPPHLCRNYGRGGWVKCLRPNHRGAAEPSQPYESRWQQDAQLWQRDRAAGCLIVFAKSSRLELEDNILQTL